MLSSRAAETFNEYAFKSRVDKALEKVRTILDNTRNPQYPSEVHHEYDDKYILSEFLANSTIATFINSLDSVGLNGKAWEQVKEWSKTRNVTLRLRAEEGCKFIKKQERNVESDTKHVTKAGILGKFESYTVTKITEWLWEYNVKWEIVAFVGVESDKAVVLQSHNGTTELKTTVEETPKPEKLVRPNIDVNFTWLLQHTDETKTPKFSIDRKSNKCRTPRRNPEVKEALRFVRDFTNWGEQVNAYFKNTVFPEQLNHGLDLASLNPYSIFVPVLPLFEESPAASSSANTTAQSHQSSKIPPVFINSFLAEQSRSLDEKRKELAKVFTENEKLVTLTEANIIVILQHLRYVGSAYVEGVNYIEDMLYKQLVAAIGKVVTPIDFTNYVTFHYRKIFNESYRPQAFSYAIRRPDHYPEGVLSIEAQLDDGALSSPISTIVARSAATRAMHFSLNAATKVAFFGERFLHGYVSHQFEGYSGTDLSLYARARQFSSFILLVGRIVSADLFEPKYATIIQNKDELKIPLLLETIPTPKEFKDAIESLSPEQQRFCKAFRSMQLESTLFGVCVIQIKPQLEKLLKLPQDSLTKEIQLSQDLLNLFIKYQIPSDLVSYDGPESELPEKKTAKVQEYVARMHEMIAASKKRELDEAKQEQEMRLRDSRHDHAVAYGTLTKSGLDMDDLLQSDMSSGEIGGMVHSSSEKKKGGLLTLRKSKSKGDFKEKKYKKSKAKKDVYVEESVKLARRSSGTLSNGSSMAPPAPPASFEQAAQAPEVSEQAQEQAKEQPKDQNQPQEQKEKAAQEEEEGAVVDYTKVPAQLEQKFEEFDDSNSLRPTIINPGNTWTKTFHKSLLSEAEKKTIEVEEQNTERNKAFDLLDALTKSGALSVDFASLHVIIASTHCFEHSIITTIIKDNVNPIEKVENSALIVASTIHQTPPHALVTHEQLDRIASTSAKLFADKDLIEM
eukprot:Phypoly_transcript_01950.p1 GENE.Phypoly_transcript_01950~~Phypoly_transcript_01950.p1  ORF type:complete len:961 (+),score=229.34 Phypoly_transcript_01950:117-2999(+)